MVTEVEDVSQVAEPTVPYSTTPQDPTVAEPQEPVAAVQVHAEAAVQEPAPEQLEIGHIYSRAEARALTGGGSVVATLPHKGGEPLAWFCKEKYNPRVRMGYLALVMDSLVERVLQERTALPVFVAVAPGAWEYIGRWRPQGGLLRHGPIYEQEAAACRKAFPGRDVAVVIMEPTTSE